MPQFQLICLSDFQDSGKHIHQSIIKKNNSKAMDGDMHKPRYRGMLLGFSQVCHSPRGSPCVPQPRNSINLSFCGICGDNAAYSGSNERGTIWKCDWVKKDDLMLSSWVENSRTSIQMLPSLSAGSSPCKLGAETLWNDEFS